MGTHVIHVPNALSTSLRNAFVVLLEFNKGVLVGPHVILYLPTEGNGYV